MEAQRGSAYTKLSKAELTGKLILSTTLFEVSSANM